MANESPPSSVIHSRTRATRFGCPMPGGGDSIKRSTSPNIDALAAMASANVNTTLATKPGSRRKARAAETRSLFISIDRLAGRSAPAGK